MRGIMLGFGAGAALLLVAGLAWTQEEEVQEATGGASEESVRKLIALSGTREAKKKELVAAWKQMMPAMPESTWDDLVSDEDIDALVDCMVPVYIKHFTQAEMDAWIAFLETPMGRKVTEKTGNMTPDLLVASQEWAMSIVPKLMAKMMQAEEGPLEEVDDEEVAVIGALRTISSVQAQFREGDRDNDNVLDYATNLAELSEAGLVDGALGSGKKHGYLFSLSGSTFDWMCAAKPAEGGEGKRHFIVCTDGVVRFADGKDAQCTSPAVNADTFRRGRQAVDEETSAIGALRTISSVQAQFREGDRDDDNILDYAASLAELSQAGLIDNVLGSGTKNGYVFSLSGSTFDWMCLAVPEDEESEKRKFVVCTDGVVRYSTGDKPDCNSAPIW